MSASRNDPVRRQGGGPLRRCRHDRTSRTARAGAGGRRGRLLAAAVCLAGLAAGCYQTGVSHMTVYNANPYPVTIDAVGGAYSIGACGTGQFTWDGGWKAVSGAGDPIAGSVPITLNAMQGPEHPSTFFEVVSGNQYVEYLAFESPSIPACSAAPPPAGGSG